MYHNFFIHSSVDGHLGSFHVLAIVNSAAANTGVHVYFSVLVSQGIYLGLGILGHMVVFREGCGTPLQYSCPENPMDGGAW